MNKRKILNDPVYGFISIPSPLIFDLIEHPVFQRLRKISQMGLSHYVYPGAVHTRFQHALGAMHLMTLAINVLKSKDIDISEEEAEAAYIAILLHDIGHGPFSHALEGSLVSVSHEEISLMLMHQLNDEFKGGLTEAIRVYKNEHPKKFLHSLVSGQLDMDRLDYLNRDSFFSGVTEGKVGYDRVIKMLDVHENQLVVEQKGIHSIEKFLHSRRFMYWQVYLHKTSLAAERMLIILLKRAKRLVQTGQLKYQTGSLSYFLHNDISADVDKDEMLKHFIQLDDMDVWAAIKEFGNHPDPFLSFLAQSIMYRRLFKTELQTAPFTEDYIQSIKTKISQKHPELMPYLDEIVIRGTETNLTYSSQNEILIKMKDNRVFPFSYVTDFPFYSIPNKKEYLIYAR